MKAKNCDPCLKRDSIFSVETFSRQKQDLTDPRSTYQDRSRPYQDPNLIKATNCGTA